MDIEAEINNYNVVWSTPSKNSSGSMPLGNGDIGLNVWVEEDGDLLFYISKADAYDNNNRLVKLGRIRINISPNPFKKDMPFKQTLSLYDGEINIVTDFLNIVIWVDANNQVVHIDIKSGLAVNISVKLELWRNKERELTGMESHCLKENATVYTDMVVDHNDGIMWYYRNKNAEEPWLINRTFGALIKSDELVKTSNTEITTDKSINKCNICIYPLTAQTSSALEWIVYFEEQVRLLNEANILSKNSDSFSNLKSKHKKWWADFWNRSYVFVTGDKDAFSVTQGYILQRFMCACAGRSNAPIKFNGSIFNVEVYDIDCNDPRDFSRYEPYCSNEYGLNVDYRRWGGMNWWQNIRLVYWPMIASGDFDILLRFFEIYTKVLPDAKKALKNNMGYNNAAVYYELATMDGSLYRSDLNNDTQVEDVSHIYYQILELALMMLDYCQYNDDKAYFSNNVIPMVDAGINFYDQHFARDKNGKLLLYPANACESFWKTTNPTNEIAGIKYILTRMLNLNKLPDKYKSKWKKFLNELPEFPTMIKNETRVLAPAEEYGERKNRENPELYAVFPFRIYGIGKSDLKIAKATYENRDLKETGCWRQGAIQAAYIGDAESARKSIIKNFTFKNLSSRFPAFWAGLSDWCPDMCNGGVAMTALQKMLLQAEDNLLLILPAWPKDWNVDFKLNAPFKTTVEGSYKNGKLISLDVKPEYRRKDINVIYL